MRLVLACVLFAFDIELADAKDVFNRGEQRCLRLGRAKDICLLGEEAIETSDQAGAVTPRRVRFADRRQT
jgi:hypothetical protein